MNNQAKKITSSLLVLTLAFSVFTGCKSESDKKIEELQSQVSELQDTIKENDITTVSEDLSSIVENDITLEDMKNAINEVIKQYPPEEGVELTWVENDFDEIFKPEEFSGILKGVEYFNFVPKEEVLNCVLCYNEKIENSAYFIALASIKKSSKDKDINNAVVYRFSDCINNNFYRYQDPICQVPNIYYSYMENNLIGVVGIANIYEQNINNDDIIDNIISKLDSHTP